MCWNFFSIKNFKAILLKRDSNTGVVLWIFWNFQDHRFEENLRTAASIWRYFDTISLKQSVFFTIFYKKNRRVVHRVTTSDNEWYIEWQRMKTSDKEWYIEWQRVTTNDNKWQQVIASGTTSDKEWQRVTKSGNEW